MCDFMSYLFNNYLIFLEKFSQIVSTYLGGEIPDISLGKGEGNAPEIVNLLTNCLEQLSKYSHDLFLIKLHFLVLLFLQYFFEEAPRCDRVDHDLHPIYDKKGYKELQNLWGGVKGKPFKPLTLQKDILQCSTVICLQILQVLTFHINNIQIIHIVQLQSFYVLEGYGLTEVVADKSGTGVDLRDALILAEIEVLKTHAVLNNDRYVLVP